MYSKKYYEESFPAANETVTLIVVEAGISVIFFSCIIIPTCCNQLHLTTRQLLSRNNVFKAFLNFLGLQRQSFPITAQTVIVRFRTSRYVFFFFANCCIADRERRECRYRAREHRNLRRWYTSRYTDCVFFSVTPIDAISSRPISQTRRRSMVSILVRRRDTARKKCIPELSPPRHGNCVVTRNFTVRSHRRIAAR